VSASRSAEVLATRADTRSEVFPMINAESLRGRLIAAVPVPFDARGRLDRAANESYATYMSTQPAGGVAVWAHTGRGLLLTMEQRASVLSDWRAALAGGQVLVAAAGAPREVRARSAAFGRARAMAEQAAELGAEVILVHPPTFAVESGELERIVEDYHLEVARAGLPLILFYLYPQAGGLTYTLGSLRRLLERPEVIGIKVATLDSVMTFQEIARLVRDEFPGKTLLTGEDRFFGYSLSCGADAALVGMGAARVALQADLLRAHFEPDPVRFLKRSHQADRLSQATFVRPMEGYVQRMLWCLVHDGVIPAESSHDPWAPDLAEGEFERLGQFLRHLGGP
jgi:4-hydroxy-tetrahydrodipicolinate synthase